METSNIVSAAGLFALIFIAWLGSNNRKQFNVRVVFWGTVLQLAFGLFVFVIPAGTRVFLFLNDAVVRILDTASSGTRFLFGRLALPPGTVNENGETSLGFFLAFQGLPTVVFFSSLMAVLYHLRIMPLVIRGFAAVFTRFMRVSGAESLCTAANIFVGVESSLTIRPHLERMTRSELTTILTAGMATIASSVFAVYVFMLRGVFPAIAGHLISASILSAPAALVMSKLLYPETETPETLGVKIRPEYSRESGIIEAAINGANSGVKLLVGICALLLAFIGLVSLINLLLGWCGSGVARLFGTSFSLSLESILSWVYTPFALLCGVPPGDAGAVARLLGERTVVTEVVAYRHLADMVVQGQLLHPRSALIAAYALCGFAHIPSLAVFVGGISALVPGRTRDLARLGLRARVAATLACLMTAAVAGIFYHGESILLPQQP
jgi:CNT family concentrative nucleoside transporter